MLQIRGGSCDSLRCNGAGSGAWRGLNALVEPDFRAKSLHLAAADQKSVRPAADTASTRYHRAVRHGSVHVGSSIIEGPWPAVTSGFFMGETPELQLGTSMLLARVATIVTPDTIRRWHHRLMPMK